MKIKSLIKHNLMRAAMTLALVLACAAAWAQDVEFTLGTLQPFYFTGNQITPSVTQVTIDDTEYEDKVQFTVTYGTNINSGENSCVIYVTITAEGDHQGVEITKMYPIEKRPMTVNIPNCEKHYGADDPVFTWQLMWDDAMQYDTISIVQNTRLPQRLNGHLTRTAGETMGDYTISYEGVNPIEFANYLVTVNPGTLTITAPNPDDFSVNADSTEYTIHTATGWNFFCDALQDNATWNRFSGKTVKLGADITVTRMAGSSQHDFCGTFDGQGHTLTVNYGTAESPITADKAAPFVNVESGCIIENLHVAGDIYTSGQNAAGIAGTQYGAVTIRNCRVSTAIHSYTSGDGTHGGLVGNNGNGNGSALSIEGCVFDGKLLTEGATATNRCGGFVGWRHSEVTISNSLFAPTEVTIGTTSSATFARNGATITNCYYTTDFNDGVNFTAQGKQARSITADNYVTVENAGTATTYSTSGITSYGTGILYDNVLYAGNGDEVSLTLSNSSSGDVPEGYQYAYSTNAGTLEGSMLTMPNADVIVSAALRSTGQPVDGIGYYINNEYRFWEAIALDGTESSLGISGQEWWYFVGTDISHSGTILCSGNVNIILAYGKTMTITSSDGDGIDVNGSLTIYGQDYITGTLNVNGYYTGICSYSGGNITISGGTVNATGNYTGGIYSSGNITISDSRVTATGGSYGIRSYGNITIGCAYASDFIYASSYVVGSEGTLNIADGKAFKDVDGHPYSGIIDQVDGAYPIDGKRLYPDCVVMKRITGYGNSTESDHWVFIASPVVDGIAPSEVHNLFPSAGETSNDYDLYRFNQSADLEWQNYHQHNADATNHFNTLVIGQGYLYATKEDRTLVFSGEYPSGTWPVDVPLDYDENAHFAGWNLVGNPFAQTAIVDYDFYVMNEGGSEIIPSDRDNVEPMEGIFVKAEENGDTVTFTPNTRSKGHIQKPEPEQIVINLSTLNSKRSTSIIDRAIVRFDESRQLPKFQIRENSTKIYIPQDGKDYAIATSNGQGEMPVNFKAKENGTYTLTVSTTLNSKLSTLNFNYLHLIDNLTGADVDLLASPTYTFTAKKTDYESRFKLVFSTNDADGPSTGSGTFAFFSNGNLIVNGEGTLQIFDVLGHQLVTKQLSTLNSKLSTLNYIPGVYMLRLINGNDVRTQKMVVR